ncbi:hypothetical protein [Oxalobacter formigenes]|nr:hypothetical protein [Oxalobacter formigenes]MCZ4062622.1 hypothetical protein [Oxalobacter formigenes]QDX32647.1 hypothetical protein FPZ51_03105 [Oxalobacter formigenes]WAW07576.1 hypothetical protein NB638_08575 [Oxalobacter formigenes]
MYNETAYEYLGVASNAIVQAINCLTREEERLIKEQEESAVIRTRKQLDRLYVSRDEISAVMEEQKRVAQ